MSVRVKEARKLPITNGQTEQVFMLKPDLVLKRHLFLACDGQSTAPLETQSRARAAGSKFYGHFQKY